MTPVFFISEYFSAFELLFLMQESLIPTQKFSEKQNFINTLCLMPESISLSIKYLGNERFYDEIQQSYLNCGSEV